MRTTQAWTRILILSGCVCLGSGTASFAAVAGPLEVLDSNPRFLTDGTGKVVLLVGSHDWDVFQDYLGPSTCKRDPPGHRAFFSNLVEWGHSFTRGWHWEDAQYAPLPWRKACGNSDYTLEPPLNPAYLKRLERRIEAADKAGLYISVMLFQGWSVGHPGRSPSPWPTEHPFQKDNNCSGSKATNGRKTHELDRPAVRKLQEAYVLAMVNELNEHDNIIWEISNESHQESRDWQIHMIDLIRDEETRLPKQHPIWMSCAGSNTDLFLSPADIISPCKNEGYITKRRFLNPPENQGHKVMIADSDHLEPIRAHDGWAWASFMRGLQPIFMDLGNYVPWACNWKKGDPEWQEVRDALGTILAISEQVDLAVMAPQPKGSDFPSSGHFALFSTDEPWSLSPAPNGDEFLVYLGQGGERIELCALSPGTRYRTQWTHPLDAGVQSGLGEFRQPAGGGCRTFTNRAGSSRILRVSLASRPPRAVIRTQPEELAGSIPFTVTFDGTGSRDLDGTIDSWQWTFPTGSADQATAKFVFDTPGSWPVKLTVIDNDGLTDSAEVTVVAGAGSTVGGASASKAATPPNSQRPGHTVAPRRDRRPSRRPPPF